MRVEALAIALRSRQGWEAIDLGFRMTAHWAGPVWAAWLVVYLPMAAALLLAFRAEPMAAALAIWWMKPVADRFVLFVLSRRVFGDPAPLAQTLASWRSVLSPGLARALLLRPFGWDRSFLQPIPLLERQRGAAAQRRATLLGRRLGGHALALALVCLAFEGVVMLALALFGSLLMPAAEIGGAGASSGLADALGMNWWGMGVTVSYALAVAVVEPFFVGAGFAMYLVRRTALEGWDIELALRRAAVEAADRGRRPGDAAGRTRASLLLVGALLAGTLMPAAGVRADPAAAERVADDAAVSGTSVSKQSLRAGQLQGQPVPPLLPLDTPARRAARAVLKHSDFGSEVEELRWRLDLGQRKSDPQNLDIDWLRAIGDWVAVGVRMTAWLLLAVGAMAVVWLIARRAAAGALVDLPAAPPAHLFGLAITPDSLPDDVAAAALAAIERGQLREAVSLLYRGALSFLVHQCAMRIGEGATEGNVLQIAQPLLSPAAALHFKQLINAWMEIAYGHRSADPERLRALCQAHRRHFVALPSDPPALLGASV